jgi:GT2 family glycosyltransferase
VEQATGDVLITAVVATYNEERHIEACLAGLLSQRGVAGEIEVLVADGGSTDRTRELVGALAAADPRIRLLDNPRRLQVYAWNLGIANARGRYVTLISAHTEYGEEYMARSIDALRRSGAANVAGVQTPVGDGAVGTAIAWAMQSRFGIGNAEFRYTTEERYVDHGFSFFFEKTTAEAIGGFDESLAVNEDCDFNYRLRKSGRRVFLSPSIECRYHARSTRRALARQMFRYGYWRRKTQLRHPEFVPARVLAPPALLLALALSPVIYRYGSRRLALAAPAAYAAFLGAGWLLARRELPKKSARAVPSILATMHLCYGAGWLTGLAAHKRTG